MIMNRFMLFPSEKNYPILPGTAGSGEAPGILSADPEKGDHFRDKLYYNQRSANNHFFFIKVYKGNFSGPAFSKSLPFLCWCGRVRVKYGKLNLK